MALCLQLSPCGRLMSAVITGKLERLASLWPVASQRPPRGAEEQRVAPRVVVRRRSGLRRIKLLLAGAGAAVEGRTRQRKLSYLWWCAYRATHSVARWSGLIAADMSQGGLSYSEIRCAYEATMDPDINKSVTVDARTKVLDYSSTMCGPATQYLCLSAFVARIINKCIRAGR